MNNNNLSSQSVPTLEEIQEIYEDILRNEARISEEEDLKETSKFYRKYRKKENSREDTSKENPIIKEYRNYLKNVENKGLFIGYR